jgi:NitT/TauT family transport system permease protein
MVRNKSYRLLFIIIILIIWEVTVKLEIYNIVLLPSIIEIAKEFIKEIINGELFFATIYTIFSIILSLFFAFLLSLIIVGLSTVNKVIDNLIDFIISIAHPIPGIAILPLVIMWFGIGQKAVYFVVLHSMLWPMVINIKAEVKRLNSKYHKLGVVYNMTVLSQLLNIYLIGSIPAIITGSKIAWSRGFRAFISAEMIFGVVGTNTGLGWYLFEQRVYMDSPGLYSGLLAIILCGIFIENILFNKLEKLTKFKWGVL